MKAAPRGSAAAMATAQVAPIGARICTISAIRTIGRNLCRRRRIASHPSDILVIAELPRRDGKPATFGGMPRASDDSGSVLLKRRNDPRTRSPPSLDLLYYLHHPGACTPRSQLQAKFQSFRQMLEV